MTIHTSSPSSYNVYARKPGKPGHVNRHNWWLIAVCGESKPEFIRQLYLAQRDYTHGEEIAWAHLDAPEEGFDDLPFNAPVNTAPTLTYTQAVELSKLASHGIVPLDPATLDLAHKLNLIKGA